MDTPSQRPHRFGSTYCTGCKLPSSSPPAPPCYPIPCSILILILWGSQVNGERADLSLTSHMANFASLALLAKLAILAILALCDCQFGQFFNFANLASLAIFNFANLVNLAILTLRLSTLSLGALRLRNIYKYSLFFFFFFFKLGNKQSPRKFARARLRTVSWQRCQDRQVRQSAKLAKLNF